jgi:hypothetical protein
MTACARTVGARAARLKVVARTTVMKRHMFRLADTTHPFTRVSGVLATGIFGHAAPHEAAVEIAIDPALYRWLARWSIHAAFRGRRRILNRGDCK